MPGCATMMCCAAAEVLRMHVHLLRQEVRLLFPPESEKGILAACRSRGPKTVKLRMRIRSQVPHLGFPQPHRPKDSGSFQPLASWRTSFL